MKADANEQAQAIFEALPPRPNTTPAPTTEALLSWRDQPARAAIYQRLAEARAAFPKLIDLAADDERQHAAADKAHRDARIAKLVGKGSDAELKQAKVALDKREQDAAVAADRRDDCREAIIAMAGLLEGSIRPMPVQLDALRQHLHGTQKLVAEMLSTIDKPGDSR